MKFSSAYVQKRQIRKKISNISSNLDKNYRRKSSRTIAELLFSMQSYQEAQTIFCFVGMETEVDTIPIIEDALKKGKRVSVPLMISKGIMVAKEIHSIEELSAHAYGILEPSENNLTVEPSEIDLAVVPCLSCSHKGVRLGYGGGYYDRYMQETHFTRICICFEKLTNEEIPMSHFDLKMDMLITEIGIFNFLEDNKVEYK